MEKHALRATGILSAAVVILFAVGSFFPSGVAWGFHFFAFLPPVYLIAAALFFFAALFHILFRDISPQVNFASSQLDAKPVRSLAVVSVTMILAIVLFRVRAPLLGDGFFLVKNFADALRGTSPILLRNEPLATWSLFGVASVFNVSSYAGFQSVFLIVQIVLAIGFIVTVYLLVRILFTSTTERFFAFCFLLSLPYIQLFFGYIETYSFALISLCLYTLTAVLFLRRKVSLLVVTIVFIVMGLSHYLTVALFPSLIYLAIREKRTTGWRTILQSTAGGFVILFGVFAFAGFDIDKFYAYVPFSHFLPLTAPIDPLETGSSAYTIFSLYHFIDIFNYLILTCTASMILMLITFQRTTRSTFQSTVRTFLLLSLAGPSLLFLIMKFDWGLAKDWDVFSSFTFLVALAALYSFMSAKPPGYEKILSILLLLTALTTVCFVGLNSTVTPTIHRYEALLDSPMMPQSACYGATLHLAQYYHQAGNSVDGVGVWDRYSKRYPADSRGYQNIITNLKLTGPKEPNQVQKVYERWLIALPADFEARRAYANYCFTTGNELSSNGSLPNAIASYRQAIAVDTSFERAYIALGRVYTSTGEIDSALTWYLRAMKVTPENATTLYTIGTLYEHRNDIVRARGFFTQAARLNYPAAEEKLKQTRFLK